MEIQEMLDSSRHSIPSEASACRKRPNRQPAGWQAPKTLQISRTGLHELMLRDDHEQPALLTLIFRLNEGSMAWRKTQPAMCIRGAIAVEVRYRKAMRQRHPRKHGVPADEVVPPAVLTNGFASPDRELWNDMGLTEVLVARHGIGDLPAAASLACGHPASSH